MFESLIQEILKAIVRHPDNHTLNLANEALCTIRTVEESDQPILAAAR